MNKLRYGKTRFWIYYRRINDKEKWEACAIQKQKSNNTHWLVFSQNGISRRAAFFKLKALMKTEAFHNCFDTWYAYAEPFFKEN